MQRPLFYKRSPVPDFSRAKYVFETDTFLDYIKTHTWVQLGTEHEDTLYFLLFSFFYSYPGDMSLYLSALTCVKGHKAEGFSEQ